MALASAVDLRALHNTSKQISSSIKNGSPGLSPYGANLWDTPKYATASSKDLEPVIPSPSIFNDFDAGGLFPSVAACAVHLEFLAALHALHQRIEESEGLDELFDIKIEKKTVTRKGIEVELKDATLAERRKVKWDLYLDSAVARFLTWWKTITSVIPPGEDQAVDLPDNTLPPLDVLLVWHSFLLNPRWFRKSCNDGTKTLYHVNFPWAAIHSRLDPSNWTFSLPESAQQTFRTATSLEPDLFESLLQWGSYTPNLQQDMLLSARFSLTQTEANALRMRINGMDQRLLQCFVDVREMVADEMKSAVLRQVSFIDKMWDKLWIRSPALIGTIRRACGRYINFLRLFRLYPTTMFVPTLDIDLIWHTHQCSPLQYHRATQELAGKFVNHDDSIVQKKLDTGFKDTTGLYRMRFGQEYHTCGCWDCEALQSAIEKPSKGAGWENTAKEVSEDVAYYRAVEVARRKGEAIPIR